MNYAVWNTLHDGSIESVVGSVPGEVTVSIDISYLCEKLPTSSTKLEVRLLGCLAFEYEPFDGNRICELGEIGAQDIEILSARREGDVVSIICRNGRLKLRYEDAEIRLLEGTVVTQANLEAAATLYWKEWSSRRGVK